MVTNLVIGDRRPRSGVTHAELTSDRARPERSRTRWSGILPDEPRPNLPGPRSRSRRSLRARGEGDARVRVAPAVDRAALPVPDDATEHAVAGIEVGDELDIEVERQPTLRRGTLVGAARVSLAHPWVVDGCPRPHEANADRRQMSRPSERSGHERRRRFTGSPVREGQRSGSERTWSTTSLIEPITSWGLSRRKEWLAWVSVLCSAPGDDGDPRCADQ